MADGPVVLFDGTCNLCNGAVQFILDHERGGALRFAALQSGAGGALLERAAGVEAARALLAGASGDGDPDSVVLVEDDRAYTHSTAAGSRATSAGPTAASCCSRSCRASSGTPSTASSRGAATAGSASRRRAACLHRSSGRASWVEGRFHRRRS